MVLDSQSFVLLCLVCFVMFWAAFVWRAKIEYMSVRDVDEITAYVSGKQLQVLLLRTHIFCATTSDVDELTACVWETVVRSTSIYTHLLNRRHLMLMRSLLMYPGKRSVAQRGRVSQLCGGGACSLNLTNIV